LNKAIQASGSNSIIVYPTKRQPNHSTHSFVYHLHIAMNLISGLGASGSHLLTVFIAFLI